MSEVCRFWKRSSEIAVDFQNSIFANATIFINPINISSWSKY